MKAKREQRRPLSLAFEVIRRNVKGKHQLDKEVKADGAKLYLQPRVRVELIEEVHEEVNLEGADAKDDVLLRLRPVAAVVPARLLALHPQVDELLKLKERGGKKRVGPFS